MFDINTSLRNNAVSITAALVGGIYAATQIGPAWFAVALPTFIFVFGMERLYAALPPKIKPFAGLISLVAFFIFMLLLINFVAALWKSPIVQQALTQQSSPPTEQSSPRTPTPAASTQPDQAAARLQPIQADPEAANRIYGMFISELNERSETTKDFDKVTWIQSMTECLGSQQGTLTPQEMDQIAACADQRMKERMQKVQ